MNIKIGLWRWFIVVAGIMGLAICGCFFFPTEDVATSGGGGRRVRIFCVDRWTEHVVSLDADIVISESKATLDYRRDFADFITREWMNSVSKSLHYEGVDRGGDVRCVIVFENGGLPVARFAFSNDFKAVYSSGKVFSVSDDSVEKWFVKIAGKAAIGFSYDEMWEQIRLIRGEPEGAESGEHDRAIYKK